MTCTADTALPPLPEAEDPLPLRRFDMADELETVDDVLIYLNEAFRDGHPGFVAQAFGTIARARERGITGLAEATGVTRAGLHKALSEKGSPSLETILKVVDALGLRLLVAPKPPAATTDED